jgi:hypothetical protein
LPYQAGDATATAVATAAAAAAAGILLSSGLSEQLYLFEALVANLIQDLVQLLQALNTCGKQPLQHTSSACHVLPTAHSC